MSRCLHKAARLTLFSCRMQGGQSQRFMGPGPCSGWICGTGALRNQELRLSQHRQPGLFRKLHKQRLTPAGCQTPATRRLSEWTLAPSPARAVPQTRVQLTQATLARPWPDQSPTHTGHWPGHGSLCSLAQTTAHGVCGAWSCHGLAIPQTGRNPGETRGTKKKPTPLVFHFLLLAFPTWEGEGSPGGCAKGKDRARPGFPAPTMKHHMRAGQLFSSRERGGIYRCVGFPGERQL